MKSGDFRAPLSRRQVIRLGACALAAPAVSLFPAGWFLLDAEPSAAPPLETGAQSIPARNLLDPSQLAELLANPGVLSHNGVSGPAVICVGFKFLYDAAHIPGSLYLGPGREGNGIVALAKWGGNAPKNRPVVIYCGCCPWTQCPNIQPAYVALTNLGFSQLKVLRINQNFATDWVAPGFPTKKKDPPKKK